MKVFVVIEHLEYEGFIILAVFSSLRFAKMFKKNKEDSKESYESHISYEILEFPLDYY